MSCAFYCFAKFGWEPSKYTNLPEKEKAVIYAFIKKIIEIENEQQKKMDKEMPKTPRARR